jgi:hypothetical protein
MKITEAQDKKIPHVSRFWNQSIKLKNFPPISDFKESLNIHQRTGRAQGKHRWTVTHCINPPLPHQFLQLQTLSGLTRLLSLKRLVKVSDLASLFRLPKTLFLFYRI